MSKLHSQFIDPFYRTSVLIRRSGALQQMFYGSPLNCPVLGFSPPFLGKTFKLQLLHHSPLALEHAQDAKDGP